jgi:NhaP-type Na+/H+ or K+/H+ antiporter
MLVGILFAPTSLGLVTAEQMSMTSTLLDISLAFIVFEVGGELKWTTLKKEESKILSILLLESLTPFFLIGFGLWALSFPLAHLLPFSDPWERLAFTLLLASMASPTDPTTTLAVIHQYKAKGKVRDTILSVAALDDAMGILLFTLASSLTLLLIGSASNLWLATGSALIEIVGGILLGLVMGSILHLLVTRLTFESEGQLIVILFSLIALCYGLARYLQVDNLLSCMVMGLLLTNTHHGHRKIFQTIRRYTEELIFVFFFVLSGLHLDVTRIPLATLPILIYVVLRTIGKFSGSNLGARLSHADPKVRRYTFGGLIPQGGIVIGLALITSQRPELSSHFDLLITIVMGATLIHELVGPITARHALYRAGEIPNESSST